MIEVLFGESEAGAMKAAKNKIVIGTVKGPTSVWMAGKKTPPAKPFSGWIEGTAQEVICLGFMMDVGDIREPMESPYRKELICSMYAQNQWAQEEETKKEIKEAVDVYTDCLHRLIDFLDDGEAIRIWYSDAPYSRCGFYSLCRILEEYENAVSTVKLPEYIVRGKTIVSYYSWNEVSAEEFAVFLPYEKPLSKEEIRRYAMLWNGLAEENSPLRAVICGKVLSVPEDFYDFLIWRWLGDAPVKEGRVIGNILGHTQLGVGDWWYAGRIEYYIGQGEIEIVEDSENKYARVIRRRKGQGK